MEIQGSAGDQNQNQNVVTQMFQIFLNNNNK
jgi:hypothetical protein